MVRCDGASNPKAKKAFVADIATHHSALNHRKLWTKECTELQCFKMDLISTNNANYIDVICIVFADQIHF